MPQYKVKKQGFMNGVLYQPNGKRNVVVTDKPLKSVPAWLEPISAAAAKVVKSKAKRSASKKEIDEQKKEIDSVNFTEPPKATHTVETL